MVFRVSRGKVLVQIFDLDDEEFEENKFNQNLKKKSIFFIAHPQGSKQIMTNKLLNLCDIFGVKNIEIPTSDDEFKQTLKDLNIELEDILNVNIPSKKSVNSNFFRLEIKPTRNLKSLCIDL